MQFDLSEFREFPPQQNGHAQPMLSINEKGTLAMNRAFLQKLGGGPGIPRLHPRDGVSDPAVSREGAQCPVCAGRRRGEKRPAGGGPEGAGVPFSRPLRLPVGPGEPGLGRDLPGDGGASQRPGGKPGQAAEEVHMRKQGLSRRERNMVEEAVTQVCWAMGVNPRDGELRQTAWAEILSVYREDPAGFRGSGMRGWRLACDLAGEAVWKEEQYRQRRKYGELSLDQPVKGDTETTLLQLLHSPAGSCENSVCLWDYLSRQHPDVQRTAQGLLEGETLDQVRDCCRWTRDHAYWAFYTLRAAMEEYLKIQ